MTCAIGVTLSGESIGVRVVPGTDTVLDGLKVFFGASNLCLVSRKRENAHGGKKAMTQKTPKGEEIPVPKRKDFLKNLKKAAKPSQPDGSKKKR